MDTAEVVMNENQFDELVSEVGEYLWAQMQYQATKKGLVIGALLFVGGTYVGANLYRRYAIAKLKLKGIKLVNEE